MLNEEQLRAISRLSKTQEGIDFMEILQELYFKNAANMLCVSGEDRAVFAGRGQVLHNLIKVFESADDRLGNKNPTLVEWL